MQRYIKSSCHLHEVVNAYPVREYFHCSELARHHPRHLAQLNANIQSAVVARGIQQPLLVAAVFQLAHIAVVEEVAGLFDSDSFAAVAAAAAEAANIADTVVAVAEAAPETVAAAVVAVAPPHFLV